MYRILVVYYTQSGQLRDIVMSVTSELERQNDIEVIYEELMPEPPFPFPWTSDEFFQAFPESVKGIPCNLQPLKASGEFDLVMVAYQPWFLSPSIPIHAFFRLPQTKSLINGKPVVILTGCRNMWVVSTEKIKQYIHEHGGKPVGNIVLYDKHSNLLSVISIMHWMFTGKKEKSGFIPAAGIDQRDIDNASVFGKVMLQSLRSGNLDNMQKELCREGAVDVNPELILFERRGSMFFKIWADFILKKGSYGSKERAARLSAFKYYLLTVIYLISPLGSLVFRLLKPFRKRAIEKQKTLYQSMY